MNNWTFSPIAAEVEMEKLRRRIALKDSLLSAANLAIRDQRLQMDQLAARHASEREEWASRVIALEDALQGVAA